MPAPPPPDLAGRLGPLDAGDRSALLALACAAQEMVLRMDPAVADREGPPPDGDDPVGRAVRHRELALRVGRLLGEDGLRALVERVREDVPEATGAFLERAGDEGGVLAFGESRLGDPGDAVLFSDSLGCLGSSLAIFGGAGMMVLGMATENTGAFAAGAVILGVGIYGAATFC